MSPHPSAEAVRATAETAGLDLPPDTGVRIAIAIAPAFQVFAPVPQTLPLDLEPATFLVVQAGSGCDER